MWKYYGLSVYYIKIPKIRILINALLNDKRGVLLIELFK